jgi:hypothetical protein
LVELIFSYRHLLLIGATTIVHGNNSLFVLVLSMSIILDTTIRGVGVIEIKKLHEFTPEILRLIKTRSFSRLRPPKRMNDPFRDLLASSFLDERAVIIDLTFYIVK